MSIINIKLKTNKIKWIYKMNLKIKLSKISQVYYNIIKLFTNNKN